jgi:hypothetical protein
MAALGVWLTCLLLDESGASMALWISDGPPNSR